MRSIYLAFIHAIIIPATARAFVPMHANSYVSIALDYRRNSRALSQREPTVVHFSIEDVVYNMQSTAGSMASTSLTSMTPSSLAVLYFAGLLTSFSPCSLGLLPLTISYISGAAGERDDKQVFFPTVAFALGLASVFCGLGLAASLLGGVFGSSADGNILGSIILTSLSCVISIAMGLQLLELVNIPLPSIELGEFGDSNKNEKTSGKVPCKACSEVTFDEFGNVVQPTTRNGSKDVIISGNVSSSDKMSLFRTFLLGGSSAFVASPCATPVLTSILGFVAGNKDAPFIGAILLFTYTIGYTTPLLVVSATGSTALIRIQSFADDEESSIAGKIAQFINPLTGGILIWFGTTGFLEAFLGNPSIAGLAPILD